MKTVWYSCLAACALVCPGARAAEQIVTQISDYPLDCVEGQQVGFTVNYQIAPELGEVTLHVELKNTRHMVLDAQTAQVSGKGSRRFTFTAPPRAQEQVLFFAVWYGELWTEAIVPILQTEQIPILTVPEAEAMKAQEAAATAWREQNAQQLPPEGAVAVLIDDLPGLDRDLAYRVGAAVAARGLLPIWLTAEQVSNPYLLTPNQFHTLILVNAGVYPRDGLVALDRYLASGGDLIALGTPAFEHTVTRIAGRWMGEAEFRQALAAQPPERVVINFETEDIHQWEYGTGDDGEVVAELERPGANGTGHCFHAVISDYRTWNTWASPRLERPFGPGQTLTCLWARGGPRTRSLALEWVEADGSRWIATVPLSTEWQHLAVTPQEFKFWQDGSGAGRGFPGDCLKPENAVRFSVGIAMTHTRMDTGRHEFWVDEIGVATNPLGMIAPPAQPQIPPIELIAPLYKFHRVTNTVSLRFSDKQCLLPPGELPVPNGLMSLHPRPQGTGFNKERKWRWIPLLEAFDQKGEVCGTPAAMVINKVGRLKDSVIVSFALPPQACSQPAVVEAVATIAHRIHHKGLFLFEGGSEYFAYFQGEQMRLGARTVYLGPGDPPPCRVRLTVSSEGGREFEQTVPVLDGVAQCVWQPETFSRDTYEVTCTLEDEAGQVVDRLAHPVLISRPPANPQFMQLRDGQLTLRGEPWRAHGVNYMPSSGIGIEDGEYFEYWMDKQPYDPVVIERDLRRIKAIGLNMVSIFCYYRSRESRNLVDILERCRRLGLMVNLSLRPGTPLDFRWEEMRALIELNRLAQCDTVFAYDLAWEPTWGGRANLRRWDPEWERWILERYGSLESAEQDWGMPVPREDGKVAGPSDEQLSTEGPHRIMVCAYRRFLDDLLAKAHARANGLVKSIDPNHLTSFRMSSAGDPLAGPPWMGYDFRGLARSVDIMEPEGYGRIGGWEQIKHGRFTADYARCMAPGRPVIWAEYGWSPYGADAISYDAERKLAAGRFYDLFLRMVHESQADGSVCWWYPGGFRVGENSDFGIINPDGTWRPVTQVLSEWAPRITGPRTPVPVDEWIRIDRDETARGLVGVYAAVRDHYWDLIEQGKNPGLRTDGFGLTSITAPRLAVGNVPYRPGQNPHKYLNAEFDRLEILNQKGVWEPLTDGCTVRLRRGQPVLIRATIGNTGEATWIAGSQFREGLVCLSAGEASTPIAHDVPFTGTTRIEQFQVCELQGDMEFAIQMIAWPDVTFGEKVRVRLRVEREGQR